MNKQIRLWMSKRISRSINQMMNEWLHVEAQPHTRSESTTNLMHAAWNNFMHDVPSKQTCTHTLALPSQEIFESCLWPITSISAIIWTRMIEIFWSFLSAIYRDAIWGDEDTRREECQYLFIHGIERIHYRGSVGQTRIGPQSRFIPVCPTDCSGWRQ